MQLISALLEWNFNFESNPIASLLSLFPRTIMSRYATVTSLLSALGFGGAIYPFCYCIGWDGEDTMAI
jgi:hypothetical protein